MKTIITQTIDGYTIITGIGDANGLIDPVKTEPVATEALKKTEEYKAVDLQKTALIPIIQAAAQAKKNAKVAKTIDDRERYLIDYRARQLQAKDIMEELKKLTPALIAKQAEMRLSSAVYFHPKPGEKIIPDDYADEVDAKMQAATEKGKRLSEELKEIDDYRGGVFWKKDGQAWIKREIKKLGEKPASGEIKDADMSPEQIAERDAYVEKMRIAALKPADRSAEKDRVLLGLLSQANAMRGELEIKGDNQALKKSRDWYDAEVVRVTNIYG